MVVIKTRPNIASASLPGKGQGQFKAQSGAELPIAGRVSEDGMTPVEMMDAALAGCIALSIRIAAREFEWQDRLEHVNVDVQHKKAEDGPSRVVGFSCAYDIRGDFSEEDRQKLIARAHELCTVGNTLGANPEIVDVAEIVKG